MGQRPIQFAHVVSFRLTDDQALLADELRASFENQTWAEMGRWLFSDDRIHEIIRSRLLEELDVEFEFEPA